MPTESVSPVRTWTRRDLVAAMELLERELDEQHKETPEPAKDALAVWWRIDEAHLHLFRLVGSSSPFAPSQWKSAAVRIGAHVLRFLLDHCEVRAPREASS